MSDQWTERLSEYLDGELSPAEREGLESHLADCAGCRAVLAELGQVAARAARLPVHQPPARVWAGIAAAIGLTGESRVVPIASRRPGRRISLNLAQLAVAAVLLLMLGAGGAWVLLRPAAPPMVAARTDSVAQTTPLRPVANFGRGRPDSAIAELERVLAEERGHLDTTTVRVIEENLSRIDRAIGEARSALARDPNNTYLNDHLAQTMRKKIELLRRAAQLAVAQS